MPDLETVVRSALAERAATITEDTLRYPGPRNPADGPPGARRWRTRAMPVLAAVAVVGAVAVAVVVAQPRHPSATPSVGASRPTRPATSSGPVRYQLPAGTSPLVTGTEFLTTGHTKTAGQTLQLRSVADGHLIRTLITHPEAQLSAGVAPDGLVILAESRGCTTTLLTIDTSAGQQHSLGSIPESVNDLTVSPDGRKIAYVTYPSCPTNPCSGTTCAAPAMPLPGVLVVTDLATGASVRTDTGDALGSLAWSPDSKQIAAAYSFAKVLVFDAVKPEFATATRIPTRPGCYFVADTWTTAGIIAAESCHPEPYLSPARLVQITLTGQSSSSWQLPACIDGLGLTSTPGGAHTLVQADIGYGGCGTSATHGRDRLTRIVALDTAQLRTVLPLRGSSAVGLAAY